LFCGLFFWGCHDREGKVNSFKYQNTLFELLDPDSIKIHFINSIAISDSINILNYEYLYNGGGVGVGDFDNDGLPDLFFVGNTVSCRVYLNKFIKGKLSFEDVTETSGINNKENSGFVFGVSVIDINQDGWQDIYLSIGGPGLASRYKNKLFINQGLNKENHPFFMEMAAEYGLADNGFSIQATFFDYDHDGDLDMYLLRTSSFERSPSSPLPIIKDGSAKSTDRLYRNDPNIQFNHPVFTDVSKDAGILEEGFGLGVSLLDINEDGWLDIYVTDDYISNDLLYVNNKNGTFSEKLSQYFKHTSHFAMGNDVGDINNDGLQDIVAVDMLPDDHYRRKLMFGANNYDLFYNAINKGYAYQYMRNTLQLNNGNGSFSEIGQLAGIYKTDWSWAPLIADFDNDEYQDIFISNGFRKDIMDMDFVKFRSSSTGKNINPKLQKKLMLDSLDVRPGKKLVNYVYKNNADLTFTNVSKEWGFDIAAYSNGAAYADLDADGDLDLVVNNIDEKAHVYLNKTRDKNPLASHYLDVKLLGTNQNLSGIGSKVTIRYNGKLQTRLKSVVRGFESTVEDNVHFGLGSVQQIDTLEVQWPDGKISRLTNVKTNQRKELNYKSAIDIPIEKIKIIPLFEQVKGKIIDYRHQENDFVDFNYDPLLPHKLSQEGPGIAVADVNKDGLEDLYIGGALLQSGKLFLQRENGTFEGKEIGVADFECEDMGCLFFDADDDGDNDLYVVSGGNEYAPGNKRNQDRLYMNDGKGGFVKDETALPETLASGSCVIAADYDHDGDLDLFIGGRLVPGAYPTAPRSYILRNNGKGKFEDVTSQLSPDLEKPGMVVSALWTDYDNDGWMDLVMAGEYMPVTFFRNENGKQFIKNKNDGLENSDGWWNSLAAGDFDNDGDIDYVAGNLGLNTPYKASNKEPFNVTYKDFDNNGSIEAISSYYEGGINYPAHSLDDVISHLPILKKKFLYYHVYANTSTSDLLKVAGNEGSRTLFCKTFQSAYIENTGDGKFKLHQLAREMQFAPVYGIEVKDVNLDGNLDFMAVGNSYAPEVVVGRNDAFTGQVMLGDGKGNFKSMNIQASGFFVDGDAKGLVQVKSGKDMLVIATQNNDSVKGFKIKNQRNLKQVMPDKKEMTVLLKYKNGTASRAELNYGSGYLSQSSRTIIISADIKEIELFDGKGNKTRTIHF